MRAKLLIAGAAMVLSSVSFSAVAGGAGGEVCKTDVITGQEVCGANQNWYFGNQQTTPVFVQDQQLINLNNPNENANQNAFRCAQETTTTEGTITTETLFNPGDQAQGTVTTAVDTTTTTSLSDRAACYTFN